MGRYMLVYKGDATDPGDMSAEDREAEMGRWMVWGEKVGSAMVDFGSPFAASTSVVDDGSRGQAAPLSGYTIVEADDLEAATAFTDGHPFLRDGTGDFAIDVFEMVDMSAG